MFLGQTQVCGADLGGRRTALQSQHFVRIGNPASHAQPSWSESEATVAESPKGNPPTAHRTAAAIVRSSGDLASSGRQRPRVLPGVKAASLRSAPAPRATALTPAPRTLVQMALDDDAQSYAPFRIAPWRVLNKSCSTWSGHRASSSSTSCRTTPASRPDGDAGREPLVGILRLPFGCVGAESGRYGHSCVVLLALVWSKAVHCRKALPVSSLQYPCATLNHHRTRRSNVGLQHRDNIDSRNQNGPTRTHGTRTTGRMRAAQPHRSRRSQRPRSIRLEPQRQMVTAGNLKLETGRA